MEKHLPAMEFLLSPAAGRREVRMVFCEHRPWDRLIPELDRLREKIGEHLSYIKSGLYLQHHPEYEGLPVKFLIIFPRPPVPEVVRWLDETEEMLQTSGITLQCVWLDSETGGPAGVSSRMPKTEETIPATEITALVKRTLAYATDCLESDGNLFPTLFYDGDMIANLAWHEPEHVQVIYRYHAGFPLGAADRPEKPEVNHLFAGCFDVKMTTRDKQQDVILIIAGRQLGEILLFGQPYQPKDGPSGFRLDGPLLQMGDPKKFFPLKV